MIKFNTQKPQTYTPTLSAYTKLLLDGKSFEDLSTSSHTVTNNGDVTAGQGGNPLGFGGTGEYAFDGTGDYLQIGQSTDFNVSSNNFVIDFWMYPRVESRNWLLHRASSDYWLSIDYHNLGTRNISIWASSNGTSWDLLNADGGGNGIGTISLPLNAWSHVAYVRSGNQWMTFINGVRDLNVTVSGTVIDAGQDIVIGKHATASYDLNAKIALYRILNGTDNGWTGATIDVPTSPYKVI